MVEKSKGKYIHSLKQKKQRDEEGVFVAEGPKIINELLKEPATQLVELFATKEWLRTNEPVNNGAVREIDEHMLSRISLLSTPNQVLGIFKKPPVSRFVAKGQISLLLETIQDPGNMGSIIRCADWFGVRQVVCSYDCVDIFNPKTVQSTMGSIARVKVFYEDLSTVMSANKDTQSYAATLNGINIREVGTLKEGMIIIGNESKGISENLTGMASQRITIPGNGTAESLNAAVATGIILSHLMS
jgi:TrmH family RNA methyltransferase